MAGEGGREGGGGQVPRMLAPRIHRTEIVFFVGKSRCRTTTILRTVVVGVENACVQYRAVVHVTTIIIHV